MDVAWPREYSREGKTLGVEWPTGLLLYGPPGCGKSVLTKARLLLSPQSLRIPWQRVCMENGADLRVISVSTIFGSYVGESEKALRSIFEKAEVDSQKGNTVVLFFEEIDSLCPRRRSDRPHESRVVSQLLTLLDGTAAKEERNVVIVASTSRPNALDPALRRPGRLDREVEVTVPDAAQRLAILKANTVKLKLSGDLDLRCMAERTYGYSRADLSSLCREAAMNAVISAGPEESFPEVDLEDFEFALSLVCPSVVRSYSVEVEPVRWDDIGGLEDLKRKLRRSAEWPLLHREAFERLGLKPAKGILLYGPPGCCKTTLARAVATGCRAHLIPLSCSQIFSMYSGEGEAVVRESFKRARLAAPSVILLDEVDAMAASRSGEESGSVERRLLSCLLTEMDGLEQTKNILVIAATNRPDVLDQAIIRPGRLDVHLFVGPPDRESRLQILEIRTKDMPLHPDVDLAGIADSTEYFSGAELKSLCSEAGLHALRENVEEASVVERSHFEAALKGIHPALNEETLAPYKKWGGHDDRLFV